MKSQNLLFFCLLQIMNLISTKKNTYKYISNPKTELERISNFSSKEKMEIKLKSSFIQEEVKKLILEKIKGSKGTFPKKIDYQIISNKYTLDDYYGKVYMQSQKIFGYEIIHSTVKASQSKSRYDENEVKKELLKESRIKMEEKYKNFLFEINKIKN